MTLLAFRQLLARLIDSAIEAGWSPTVIQDELQRMDSLLRDEPEPSSEGPAPF